MRTNGKDTVLTLSKETLKTLTTRTSIRTGLYVPPPTKQLNCTPPRTYACFPQ
jgi:hypothetical protein